jgi:hypothetical protein
MLLKATCISLLMVASAAVFADKIVIKGAPVILQENQGVYVAPNDFNATGDYYYVTVAGSNRVCYLAEQPTFTIKPVPISVRLGEKNVTWQCYEVDPTYFEVQP